MAEKKKTKKVPEKKLKRLKELVELIEKNRTIMISSALNIPSGLFQKIRKDLRDKANIMIVKKSMGKRALDECKKEKLKEMEKYIEASTAIIFSSIDPYELAGILGKSKQPAFAKAGQESPEDLTIDKGPTELPPGPAISELGAVGLKVGVEGGKISIKESKTIVKRGEVIKKTVSDVLQKLEIKPFTMGISPIAAFDTNDNKIYMNIIIDEEGFLNQLTGSFSAAFNLSLNLGYVCKDNVDKILERIEREAIVIQGLIKEEPKVEGKQVEEKKEEVKPEEAKPAEQPPAEEKPAEQSSSPESPGEKQ